MGGAAGSSPRSTSWLLGLRAPPPLARSSTVSSRRRRVSPAWPLPQTPRSQLMVLRRRRAYSLPGSSRKAWDTSSTRVAVVASLPLLRRLSFDSCLGGRAFSDAEPKPPSPARAANHNDMEHRRRDRGSASGDDDDVRQLRYAVAAPPPRPRRDVPPRSGGSGGTYVGARPPPSAACRRCGKGELMSGGSRASHRPRPSVGFPDLAWPPRDGPSSSKGRRCDA